MTDSGGLYTDYGAVMRDLVRRAAERRQPVSGTFELTGRCNLSCRMCYIRHAANDSSAERKELTAAEWLELASQAAGNGMVFLLLTGGEVFLRPDFFQIYEPLTQMGFLLKLFTNGTLITSTTAERLAQAPPMVTEITLYGATPGTYEAITGVPGSYSRCCAGIEALVARKIPLALKTTVTQQNVHELEVMRQMARNWGVPFLASWLLSKRPDGGHSDVEACRLPAIDCVSLEASDKASAREWTDVALSGFGKENLDNFYCQGGKASFSVTPSGEMNVCGDLPLPAVRPLEFGFPEAWQQLQRYVDSCPPMSSVCLACEGQAYCPRCPAWSLMETGTLSDPVPYLCDIALTRKQHYEQIA